MEYRCVTTSVEGFVQQLAVAYITHGYWFYVAGEIPDGKQPEAIDAKLIDRYGIAISKWARCRRKKQGLANMQYLRHERFFVLLATKGRHEFFEREPQFKDVRRKAIPFGGYSISLKRGTDGKLHSSVRIDSDEYLKFKAQFLDLALYRSVERMSDAFAAVRFSRYAPVRRQLLNVWRAVNRVRNTAGLDLVPIAALRLRRATTRAFAQESHS